MNLESRELVQLVRVGDSEVLGEDRESGRSEVGWTAHPTSVSPEFFQLSPPRLVFCLKTLAFGKICWEEQQGRSDDK